MTKKQIAVPATVVTTLVTTEPTSPTELTQVACDGMPSVIELVGPAFRVLSEASVLIRAGYVFSIDPPPTMFASTGQMVVQLVPGEPEKAAVDAAKEALEHALSREQFVKMDAKERVAAAEKKLVEETAQAAVKAAIAAQIAAQQESLRQLQASFAAA